MNSSFTKIQTLILIVLAIVVAWGGAVLQLRGSLNLLSDSATQIPPGTLPQTVAQSAPSTPLPFVRGILVENKGTELVFKMDLSQEGGKNVRQAVLSANTKFVERTLKPAVELKEIMQTYLSELAANPGKDIPFPKTYVSERTITKVDLKVGDALALFAKDTSAESIAVDLVARITNP